MTENKQLKAKEGISCTFGVVYMWDNLCQEQGRKKNNRSSSFKSNMVYNHVS